MSHRLLDILHRHDKVGFVPWSRLPPAKMRSVSGLYFVSGTDQPIGLIDMSLFGTGSTGLVLTSHACRSRNSWFDKKPQFFSWDSLRAWNEAVVQKRNIVFADGRSIKTSGHSPPERLLPMLRELARFFNDMLVEGTALEVTELVAADRQIGPPGPEFERILAGRIAWANISALACGVGDDVEWMSDRMQEGLHSGPQIMVDGIVADTGALFTQFYHAHLRLNAAYNRSPADYSAEQQALLDECQSGCLDNFPLLMAEIDRGWRDGEMAERADIIALRAAIIAELAEAFAQPCSNSLSQYR